MIVYVVLIWCSGFTCCLALTGLAHGSLPWWYHAAGIPLSLWLLLGAYERLRKEYSERSKV